MAGTAAGTVEAAVAANAKPVAMVVANAKPVAGVVASAKPVAGVVASAKPVAGVASVNKTAVAANVKQSAGPSHETATAGPA